MEKTDKMSVKTVRDRAAALGAANTYADVMLNAAGVLVASSRQDHLVKMKDGDNYVHVYLADTPCDYRGVMFVGSWRVETGVCKSMDEALSELRGNWGALYKEGLDSLRRAAVANALEEKRDRNKPPRQDGDAEADRIHRLLEKAWNHVPEPAFTYEAEDKVVGFKLTMSCPKEGLWIYEARYKDRVLSGGMDSWATAVERVWWRVCTEIGAANE